MPDPFATAGELAQYLQLGEPSDLARWQQHLANASALIRGFCGQQLSQVEDDQVTIAPSFSVNLYLPERPVTSATVLEGFVPVTAFTLFESSGILVRTSGTWNAITTVTYDHGFAEFSPEYETLKGICLEIAARSVTNNERSASEAMGGTIMETAGFSPSAFLTEKDKWSLSDFGLAGIG